jgi:hypothetical protein
MSLTTPVRSLLLLLLLLLLLVVVGWRGAGGGRGVGLKKEEEEDMFRLEERVEERRVEVAGEGEEAREDEVVVPAKADMLVSCREGEGGAIIPEAGRGGGAPGEEAEGAAASCCCEGMRGGKEEEAGEEGKAGGAAGLPTPPKRAPREGGRRAGTGKPLLLMQTIRCMATANSLGLSRLSLSLSDKSHTLPKACRSSPERENNSTACAPSTKPSPFVS